MTTSKPRGCGECGDVQVTREGLVATELAVVMPALLLLIMLTVQLGLWAHASHLARAAADAAATTAAAPDATPADGQAAAAGLLAQAGNLTDVTIVVDRSGDMAIATVRGTAPHVVPRFRWRVSATAAAPLEVFVPEGERAGIPTGGGG
jgi:Flp pilus assembly protein TadG